MKQLLDITITNRIENLLKAMNKNLFGKEEAIRLALLCAVAGESCFLMGPPGTAKSMISRRVQKIFKGDTTYFEYLMNEFTTPDEICGPVSLKNLENDVYNRITTGFLPEANIAFLDEIWKSGPAILNTLLTIINEKIYHNGNEKINVPLKALIAASNEFPAKGRGLEALWDRFVVRVKVDGVKSKSDFFKLVDGDSDDIEIPEELKISLDELENWKNEINKVTLNENAKDIILSTRKMMDEKNKENEREDDEKYYVSDRRWKKIVHLLKTSAFLNGRTEVLKTDCTLIRYCIWGTEKQHDEVKREMNSILDISGWAKESIKKISTETSLNKIEEKIKEFESNEKTLHSITPDGFATFWHNGMEYYICKRRNISSCLVPESSRFIDERFWFFPVEFPYYILEEMNYEWNLSYHIDELRTASRYFPNQSAVIYVSPTNVIDKDARKITLSQDSVYKDGRGAVVAKNESMIVIGKRNYKYSKFIFQNASELNIKYNNTKITQDVYDSYKNALEIIAENSIDDNCKNLFSETSGRLSLENRKDEARELLERLENLNREQQHISPQEKQKIEKDLDLIWKN